MLHFPATAKYLFTHCREELDDEELARSHGRKAMLVRQAAVIAAAKALEGDAVNWDVAVSIFKDIGGGLPARAVGSHIRDFVRRWWDAFITTGSLEDAPRSGRPPLVPDSVAAHAAELVKAGQWVPRVAGQLRFHVQLLFRTIPAAVHALPELGQICEEYGVTSEQLRNAMERVDHDLVRHALRFKYAHSAEQMQGRQSFCRQMLAALLDIPAAQAAILDRFLWWDEGGVSLSAVEHKAVYVWGGRGALQSYDVLRFPGVHGGGDCKIHFGIGVSSHPAFARSNGLVYFEFTTGTTAIKRLRNMCDDDEEEQHRYKVRNKLLQDQDAKVIVPQQAVHAYCL